MTKITKFPSALISGDCTTSSLRLDGGSIIDQCIVTAGESGTFFLEQHLLYVVLGGSVKLTCGRQSWTVGKNQMILLRKAHSVSYEKKGSPETGLFESQLFAINDELLKDFLTSQQVNVPPMTEELGAHVSPMSDRLVAYCWSLAPYFNDPSQINPGLLRLKVMELLFNVMDCSKNIFRQMLQLRQPVKVDVHRVVEENYTSPISLEELAYLSGTAKHQPSGFVRSASRKPDRCCRPHRCPLLMSPTVLGLRIRRISAESSNSDMELLQYPLLKRELQ